MESTAKPVFDEIKLGDQLKKMLKSPPKYYIGVVHNEGDNAYCLAREFDGDSDLLLSKVIADRDEFDKEVADLMKYFDAEKIEEK